MDKPDTLTIEELGRWPAGVERTELIAGALVFHGWFTLEDAERARQVYSGRVVTLDPPGGPGVLTVV